MLLEGDSAIARGTSYANGALLTPSMPDPWNAPGVHRHLAESLFNPHAAMKLRLRAIPSLGAWGIRFLYNSSARRHSVATRAGFVLAKYSVEKTRALRAELALEYDSASLGTMKLFRDPRAMEGPARIAESLAPLGLRFEQLDRDGVVAAEPALQEIHDQIGGGLRFPDDEAGDAFKFCEALSAAFQRCGGILRTGVEVTALSLEHGRISGLQSKLGPLRADTIVVAAGNRTPWLVRRLGISVPIRPAKGYTLTFNVSGMDGRPQMPVVDDALHAAVVPLGSRLRVAGTAEFAGADLRIRPERIENLRNLLRAVYPGITAALNGAPGEGWTGLRPMSADGLPFVGATSVPGLYINAGHGHLGWTLANGSAHLLTDLIDGVVPALDPEPYTPQR